MSIEQKLQARLNQRKEAGLYRQRLVLTSAQSASVQLKDRDERFLNFSSNDYLGLADHPQIKKAFQEAIDRYGAGSGASHLISGHHSEHEKLEKKLAKKVGAQRALVFSSGFMANIGVINTLVEKGDWVFQDKLNHASLLDGGLSSGANFQRYLHKDMDSLKTKLAKRKTTAGETLIVSDGVFSMDGDQASIAQLQNIAKANDASLMIDDAHGFGVIGEQGQGTFSAQNCSLTKDTIYMATFGKALGTGGAFVAGSETLVEALVQFCRTYVYTTAMAPAQAMATSKALALLEQESWRQTHLQQLIDRFKTGAKDMGLELMASDTPIQPILLGQAEQVMSVGEKLKAQGLLVGTIRPPTVPPNQGRLRVTLSAAHQNEDVDTLLSALAKTLAGVQQ